MSILKKFINNLLNVVDEVLKGFVVVNFGLRLLKGYRVVICEDIDEFWNVEKVIFVFGGGSGYELV